METLAPHNWETLAPHNWDLGIARSQNRYAGLCALIVIAQASAASCRCASFRQALSVFGVLTPGARMELATGAAEHAQPKSTASTGVHSCEHFAFVDDDVNDTPEDNISAAPELFREQSPCICIRPWAAPFDEHDGHNSWRTIHLGEECFVFITPRAVDNQTRWELNQLSICV